MCNDDVHRQTSQNRRKDSLTHFACWPVCTKKEKCFSFDCHVTQFLELRNLLQEVTEAATLMMVIKCRPQLSFPFSPFLSLSLSLSHTYIYSVPPSWCLVPETSTLVMLVNGICCSRKSELVCNENMDLNLIPIVGDNQFRTDPAVTGYMPKHVDRVS